jgi:hypothetical protein
MVGKHRKPAPSRKPVKKVAATGVAGSVVVVAVWVAGLFGLHVPADVASALTLLAGSGAGYLKKA